MLIPNIFLFQFANIAKGFEKAKEKVQNSIASLLHQYKKTRIVIDIDPL